MDKNSVVEHMSFGEEVVAKLSEDTKFCTWWVAMTPAFRQGFIENINDMAIDGVFQNLGVNLQSASKHNNE